MKQTTNIAALTPADSLYRGAKLMLFAGDQLVVVLRDQKPDIPWPGFWDFPGGGREADEHPVHCALRETHEELGLHVRPSDLTWARRYHREDHFTWFFAARLEAESVAAIDFGDEGQGWALMTPQAYLCHPRAIPHFQTRLADFLADV